MPLHLLFTLIVLIRWQITGTMKGFHISLSALVTLCLSLIHINVVLADEWDGIVCYEGLEAKKKMCSSCVTVYDDSNYWFFVNSINEF